MESSAVFTYCLPAAIRLAELCSRCALTKSAFPGSSLFKLHQSLDDDCVDALLRSAPLTGAGAADWVGEGGVGCGRGMCGSRRSAGRGGSSRLDALGSLACVSGCAVRPNISDRRPSESSTPGSR